MNPIVEKLGNLWPEITVLVGAIACLFTGLAGRQSIRRLTPAVAVLAIIIAFVLARFTGGDDAGQFLGLGGLAGYLKLAILGIGLILVLVATGTVDKLKQVVQAESREGKAFDPGDDFKAEFYAFTLFSLTGAMLCAGASDLVWLFLALELTSLPTYVMVATSRDKPFAQEAAVKYFFLGALSAAVFLYGFALIYGATGLTEFAAISAYVQANGVSPLMLTGTVLAVVGVCFKIAAVPMHFYTADVYEGAATPVSAFLAFVPKTAGFAALIALLGLVGWDHGTGANQTELPDVLVYLIAGIAAVTMTVGNVLGLVQTRIKRVLAYSSIAHSGYMLVGLLAGPALAMELQSTMPGANFSLSNGVAAVLFYLVAYGLSTVGTFAVIGCLTRPDGEEVQTYDDLAGLRHRHPFQAGVLLISVISLVGLPPLVGFLGKLFLIGAVYSAGSGDSPNAGLYQGLVVLMVINSAISGVYYLRIASAAFFGEDKGQTVEATMPSRRWGGAAAAAAALALGGLPGDWLITSAERAAESFEQEPSTRRDAPAEPPAALIDEAARPGDTAFQNRPG
ncbi:MAG: NADH-quinone oxidoreductase subunit N [Planctomycetota bacterium]